PHDQPPQPANARASPVTVDARHHLETEGRRQTITTPPDPVPSKLTIARKRQKIPLTSFSPETIPVATHHEN
ncbi:hypothetical protein PanWU01x14_144820, partial [Parasponia andersonii]